MPAGAHGTNPSALFTHSRAGKRSAGASSSQTASAKRSRQEPTPQQPSQPDPLCALCFVGPAGGDIISCDGCPSHFHERCVHSRNKPVEGSRWLCSCHSCLNCSSKGNFLGRVFEPGKPHVAPQPLVCVGCGRGCCTECADSPEPASQWFVCAECGVAGQRLRLALMRGVVSSLSALAEKHGKFD